MATETLERIIEIKIAGGAADQCLVTKLQGEETLAGLYQFWIECVVMQGAAPTIESDIDLLLKYAETTGGGRQAFKTRTVKGMIGSVIQLPHDQSDRSRPRRRFRLLLVPHLWLATRQVGFAHYENKKHTDIAKDLANEHKVSSVIKAGTDAARPWLLQYGETNWNFIARHSEALGYGHWVDDDGKLNLSPIEGGSGGEAITFRDEETDDARFEWATHANVFSFSAMYRSGTTKTVQTTWDAAKAELAETEVTASIPSKATDQASKTIQNSVRPFTAVDAARAKEEANAAGDAVIGRRQMFRGSSDARSFKPGHIFDLSGHEEMDLNAGYTVVTLRHEAEQEFSPGAGSMVSAKYRNTFTCIADKQAWAPERKTPAPAPPGLVTGTIMSLEDPDKLGRYQVQIPVPGKQTIQTTWIRALQRFAMPDIGDQVPLDVGTEVALAFANGDIDQPLVMGALHNGKQTIPTAVTYGEADTELKLLENRRAEHVGMFTGPVATRQSLFMHSKDKESVVSLRAATKQELLLDATDGKEFVQLTDGTREHWLEFDQAKQISRLGSGTKTDPSKNQSLTLDEKSKLLTLNTGSDDDMLVQAGKDQTTTVAGNQTNTISGDQADTVEGARSVEVTGDDSTKAGSLSYTSEDTTTFESSGDHSHKAATHTLEGDSTITLKVGSATAEITSSGITLKLGSNSVELTNSGVTVKGSMVTVEGSGNTTVKGSMLTVEASGVCTVKGASVSLG